MKVTFPKLFKWQQDVYDWFDPTGKSLIIKSLRQVGKSAICLLLLLRTAFEKPGCTSMVIEPTLAQARKMFTDIYKMLGKSPLIEKANESLLVMRFSNGSDILFKSGEQGDSLRGYTVSGILVLDECAYLDRGFIEDTLPVTNKHNATIIAVSTPIFTSGWFYEQYSSPDSDSKKSFNWSAYDTSEVLSKEKVEEYRKTYSKRKFTTEILGEFLVDDGNLFTGIEDCIIDCPPEEEALYFGIDWGSGSGKDNTVISCLNYKKEMVFIKYFNDKTPSEQVNIIIDLIKRYKPIKVTVESNSIGKVYYDMLQKGVKNFMKVNLFTTTNDSKNRIIDQLSVAIENRYIGLIRDEELLTELRAYKQEITKSGKITYNAPSGYKDDCVVSTAICYDSIINKKGQYNFA